MESMNHARAEAHYYNIMDMKEKYQKLKRDCRNVGESTTLTSASKTSTSGNGRASISAPKINLGRLFRQSEKKCDQVLKELQNFDDNVAEAKKRKIVYGTLIDLTEQLNRLTPEMEDQYTKAMQIIAFLEGLSSLLNASKLNVPELKEFEQACQEYYRQVLPRPVATIIERHANSSLIPSERPQRSRSRSEIDHKIRNRTINRRFRRKTVPASAPELSNPAGFPKSSSKFRKRMSSDNLSQMAPARDELKNRYIHLDRKIDTFPNEFAGERKKTPCKERYIRSRDIVNNSDALCGHFKSSDQFRTKKSPQMQNCENSLASMSSLIPSTKLAFDMAADDDSSNNEKIRNGGRRSPRTFLTIFKYLICISICVYLVDLSRKIYETIIVPFDNCTLAKDLCETSKKCCFKNCGSDSKSMFWTNFKRWK